MTRARSLAFVALLPLLSTGCVTARLWETRAGLARRGPPPAAPLRVERAIRDGRGALHLLVDCGAGRTYHVIVQRARPADTGPLWPHAGRTESLMVLADPAPMPTEGMPLATWTDDGNPPVDPRAPASLQASLATPGPRVARVELHGDSFELVHPDGARELLAHVAPRRRPWPAAHADEVTPRDVGAATVCVLATPLTLAADLVVIVLGVVWYPLSLLGAR